jgi:hypothetical protein
VLAHGIVSGPAALALQADEVLLDKSHIPVKGLNAFGCCRPAIGKMGAVCDLKQGYESFVRGLNVLTFTEVGEDPIQWLWVKRGWSAS